MLLSLVQHVQRGICRDFKPCGPKFGARNPTENEKKWHLGATNHGIGASLGEADIVEEEASTETVSKSEK